MGAGVVVFVGLFSSKGFLFTISVVMFASTLVFFSGAFSDKVAANEKFVLLSANNLNYYYLNDDVAFDVLEIFGISSVSAESSSKEIALSGVAKKNQLLDENISAYSGFINSRLFSDSSSSKSLSFDGFNGLTHGDGTLFFSSQLRFVYNYNDGNISLVPFDSRSLTSIDINISTHSDLNAAQWINGPSAGSVPLRIFYTDDSNYFSITANISPTALSKLDLNYAGQSIYISVGAVDGRNSSVKIFPTDGRQYSYSILATYSSGDVAPVYWGGIVNYSNSVIDSNSYLFVAR